MMRMQHTEDVHSRANGLDQLGGSEILIILYEAQLEAAHSVTEAIEPLRRGAEAMATAVRKGRKLVYAAAGSSGLQGMADGLEITPTFGVPISQIRILRAGGTEDMLRPKGEMEDSVEAALADADIVEAGDCVICLAASGTTTYPVTIMNMAKERGATTIGISNNPGTALLEGSDIPVYLPTPPEVIAGSTRLGAGTAQKIALNMMSSLMGVLLGHVMDGLMVNLIANNSKLLRRAETIVMTIGGCSRETAAANLRASGGEVKKAILLSAGARSLDEAERYIDRAGQNLRVALSYVKPH